MWERWILVTGMLLVPGWASAQATVVGQRVKSAAAPPTPASYAERIKQSPLNQPCAHESLCFPLISALSVTQPRRVAAGEFILPQYGQALRLHDILWRIVPWDEKHATFLKRYLTLDERSKDGLQKEREKIKLFVWCEKNQLPHCAEFLMRDVLFHRGANKESSLYQKNLQRWKSAVQKHPSPYTFDLPLKGQWHALVDETRHHQKKHWTVFAHDIVVQIDGTLHRGRNVKENHFAWEQPVYAVADGLVVTATSHHRDHPIGRPGPGSFANFVRIDCGGGVYADYAHLREDSVLVKKGDKVKRGQALARVGNSGASGVPHLHFSMTDRDGFSIPGRYRFEVLATDGWRELSGVNIQEGWNLRPLGE